MATAMTRNSSKKTDPKKTEAIEKAISLIQPVGEVEDYLAMLVYGRGGMGKTTFGASSDLKTIIIDFNEKGTLSVKRRKNVYVYRVERWGQLDWIYWYLKAGKHDFKVVVLDTVSSMAIIGMKWVLGDDVSRDANRDPLMPDKRSWGKLGELLKTSFYNWRNLPMHVVFTAHERNSTTEDEDTGGTLIETHPALSPAPRDALVSVVHVIGRLYTREVTVQDKKSGKSVKKVERRLLVGPHPRYVSKLRQDPTSENLIPPVVRKPTLKYFIETVLPNLKAEGEDLA